MKEYINEDFLLQNDTARMLYHDHAEKMPIIDFHCHLNPKEIAENKNYDSITQLWFGGDHYKWRAMRLNPYIEFSLVYFNTILVLFIEILSLFIEILSLFI